MSKEARQERREARHEKRDERRDARQDRHEQRVEDGTTFGQRVKGAIGSAVLAPLVILKPVMRNALEKEGMSNKDIPDKLEPLARMFHDVIIKKGKATPATGQKARNSSGVTVAEGDLENIIGEALDAIVGTIVKFIKSLKKKKDDGGKMSATEDAILEGADKVGGAAQQAIKDSTAEDIGNSLLDNKMLLIIGGVLVIGIVIYIATR